MAADRAWARLGELSLTEERAVSVATHEQDLHSRGWRLSNTIVGVLARAGLGPMHLLSTRGRRTGLIYTTPVVPVEHAGRSWLVAPYGPVSGIERARRRPGQPHGRARRDYAVREVGPSEAGPVLKRYVGVATKTRPCFQAGEDSPVEDFVAEAERHPVFELVPVGAEGETMSIAALDESETRTISLTTNRIPGCPAWAWGSSSTMKEGIEPSSTTGSCPASSRRCWWRPTTRLALSPSPMWGRSPAEELRFRLRAPRSATSSACRATR